LRQLVLVALFSLVVARSAAAAEGAFLCEHADECVADSGVEATVTWQSPPPPELSCDDELFSSAVGMCDGAVVDEPITPKPPQSCDGVSCYPNDAPVPPAPPTFSYSHPFALAALWRAPALSARALVPMHAQPLADGFPRRLDRPPRVSA
jgi:hypothetical protein